MSDRLEKLRSARRSSASVFTNLIQLNKKYNKPLFCCFEGEDFKYYSVRIDQVNNPSYDKLIPFHCGGKSQVIRLYELINKEETLKDKSILYFIDKDFDDRNENQNLYETPTYSVENFYTSKTTFERILNAEVKIEEGHSCWEHCLELFTQRQREFHDAVIYLNAWVYCQRKRNVQALYLNEFKLNSIIPTISFQEIRVNEYDKNTLKGLLPNAEDIPDDEIQNAIEQLKDTPQESFRGKFEIEFLYLFLFSLIQEINKKRGLFKGCKKLSIIISKSNMLSELSQYAITPNCLKEYLKKCA